MLFLVFFFSSSVFAYNYGFENITNNNAGDAAIGEAQLSFSVTKYSDTQVQFLFQNIGPEDSSIADIYFDDDVPLMTWSSFSLMGDGVSFSEGAKPGNLPGGKAFSFSSDYSYDSDSPVQPNGINPGEVLGIVFDYTDGYGLDQIIAALNDGSMSVGIHVQGFASGGSEGFVNTPTNPVPEPASMVLLGIGLLGVAGVSRKKILNK
ncbi:PEP-CTERM sorting domain-containing protein [Desulfocicer vacuolatum]|nr:PEP-CTERM sorting domain-containing protein [Desulfocicer vacuolatum]